MRSKARTTITLSRDLLLRLDRMVDRRTVRSRSHAVELLLRQSLAPEVGSAVLLAGGRRQGGGIPSLSPICGRPLISTTMQHLASFGIRRFVVMAGKNESEIRGCLGGMAETGFEIVFVSEGKPRGTAGALKKAEDVLGSGPFLAVNADVLTDIDIESFLRFHAEEENLATIAVKPRQSERSYGKVVLEGNRIVDFIDRSKSGGISIVNTGVYLLQPEVLGLIEEDRPSRLETDVFPKLARMRELGAFFFQGIWFDVSTPESLRLAESRWRERGGRRHAHAT